MLGKETCHTFGQGGIVARTLGLHAEEAARRYLIDKYYLPDETHSLRSN